MLGQRRTNQLDNFINMNQQNINQPNTRMISPRNIPFNNLTNNYFSNGYQDVRGVDKYERNISPNTINNTRKPMISPVRSPRNMNVQANPNLNNNPRRLTMKPQDTDRTREYYCSNQSHRSKKAEYMIHIEDEDMYYCGVCATQAASQGFTVNKIGNIPSIQIAKRQKVIPHLPNFNNNKRYHELTQLMGEIIRLENDFKKNDPKLLKDHYSQQQVLLNDFYDDLVEVVQKMRRDHIQDFKLEESKNLSTSEMQYDNLKMHMEDLNNAWDDIEDTMREVIEKVDEDLYEDGMKTYKNTLNMFQHKIQEFEESFEELTTYDQRTLASKVRKFEDKLLQLWSEQDIHNLPTKKRIPEKNVKANALPFGKSAQGTTLKNVHEMLPKGNCIPEGQGAFRNLFPEEEGQERLPEASPQFKAF